MLEKGRVGVYLRYKAPHDYVLVVIKKESIVVKLKSIEGLKDIAKA